MSDFSFFPFFPSVLVAYRSFLSYLRLGFSMDGVSQNSCCGTPSGVQVEAGIL